MELFPYYKILVFAIFLIVYDPSVGFAIAANSPKSSFVEELDYGTDYLYSQRKPSATERVLAKTELGKFVGCYDSWDKNLLKYTVSGFAEKNSLVKCIEICGATDFSFVLLKGNYCSCVAWNDFQNTRVSDSYCQIKCPGESKGICGGNHEVSVFCVKSGPNQKNCDSFELPPIRDVYKSSRQDPAPEPAYSCVNCTSGLGSCVTTSVTPLYDYAPANSPSACIKFCSRPVASYAFLGGESVRQPTKYAFTGWDTRFGHGTSIIPICKCSDKVLDHFGEVEVGNCTKECPESGELCGSLDKGVFTVYCADPYGCLTESSSPGPSTTKPTEQTHMPTTTELIPVSTDGITTEAPHTTTIKTPSTATTTTTTTSTTSTEKPVGTCSPECQGDDSFGTQWTSCPGLMATKPCYNDNSRRAKWFCKSSGVFAGNHPDMSECRSEWIDKIDEYLKETDDPIPPNNASELLQQIETEMKDSSYFGHEIRQILEYVPAIFKRLPLPSEIPSDTFGKLTNQSMDIGNQVLTNKGPWVQLSQENRSETVTSLFQVIENTLFEMARNLVNTSENLDPKVFVLNKFNVGAGGGLKTVVGDQILSYPFNKYNEPNSIVLPKDWSNVISGDQVYYQGISMSRESVQHLLPNTQGFDANKTSTSFTTMNTNIIGFTLASSASSATRDNINFPGGGVTITLRHEVEGWGSDVKTLQRKLHSNEKLKVALGSANCVYWDTTKLEWSSEGCVVVKSERFQTICQCNHLTNFAVLFDTHTYVGKQLGLEVLTIILCSLSIICLFTTIIIFTILRSTHSPRTTITKNLAICLLVGNSLVLLVMDRHYFDMSAGVCTASAIIIHYAFLSAFMWMGIEGFYLYKLMIHVFDSGSNHLTMYRILGYGIPLLVVGITGTMGFLLGEDVYGGDMFCWLQGSYIWAFLGPVAIVVIGNSTILFITLRTAYQVKTSTAQLQARVTSYKTWARGCLSLTVLLGLTWTVGFFITIDSYTASIVFGYIFTIMNGAQGILLFIFHCLLNEKVNAAAARRNINLPSWLPASVSRSGAQNDSPSDLGPKIKTNLKTVFAQEQPSEAKKDNSNSLGHGILKQHEGIPQQTRRRSNTMTEKDIRAKTQSNEDSGGTISSLDSYRTSSTDLNETSGNESSVSSSGGSQKNLIAEKRRQK